MTQRDPFRDIEELFERMDRELEKLGTGLELPRGRQLPVDVVDAPGEVIVTADVPGFTEDELSVELEDDVLTIAATPEEAADSTASEVTYRRRERRHDAVSRRIPLRTAVDETATTATYDAGVLTVTLPAASSDDDGHRIDIE